MFGFRKNTATTIDMGTGAIFPILLKVAIPLMLSGVLQVFFNAADIMVVGKFGEEQSVAAVSSTGSIAALIINLFIGLSVGTNVLCARLFGEGDAKRMGNAIHTSVLISIIIGIFLTVVGFFGAEFMLKLLNTPTSLLPRAALYLRIYFLGMVPMLVYNFASSILRAVGDTRRPLAYLTIAGIANVALNLTLVIVFKLDVAGVAIATVVSNSISAILCIRALLIAKDMTKLDLKRLHIDLPSLKNIIRVGLPAGIQNVLFSVSNVFIQSSLNSFNNEIMLDGSGAAANLEGFLFTALSAIHQSIVVFTGQNYGRRNYKRIVKAQMYGVIFAITFGAAICFGMSFFSDKLLLLYLNDPAAIEFGVTRISIIGALCFINAVSEVFVGGMRGCGYSFSTMITSLLCICGFRLLWIFTFFQIPKYHTFETLLSCYPISYAASLLVQGIFVIIVMKQVKKKLTAT